MVSCASSLVNQPSTRTNPLFTADLREAISSFGVTTRGVTSDLKSLLDSYSAIQGAFGAHVTELRTFSSAMTALPAAMKSLQTVTSKFADTDRQIRQSIEENGIGTLKQHLSLVAPSAAIGFVGGRYVLELSTAASIGWTAVTALTTVSGLSVDLIVNFIRKRIYGVNGESMIGKRLNFTKPFSRLRSWKHLK